MLTGAAVRQPIKPRVDHWRLERALTWFVLQQPQCHLPSNKHPVCEQHVSGLLMLNVHSLLDGDYGDCERHKKLNLHVSMFPCLYGYRQQNRTQRQTYPSHLLSQMLKAQTD